jgi:hypothetical protein
VRLREELRIKLANLEMDITALNVRISRNADQAQRQIQDHVDSLQRRIDLKSKQALAALSAAAARAIRDNMEAEAMLTGPLDVAALKRQLEHAERYANASMDIAIAAINEAEHAAFSAALAQQKLADAEKRPKNGS